MANGKSQRSYVEMEKMAAIDRLGDCKTISINSLTDGLLTRGSRSVDSRKPVC